jgi:CheY-like chemotaxis protein
VVDDNQVDRLKLTRILEGEGHTMSVSGDGREALEMLRSQSFDLVLLDIAMPEMSGYQVLEAMKADSSLQNTPVIAISATDESDIAAKCADLGAEDYVSKSSDPEALKARVAACLEK